MKIINKTKWNTNHLRAFVKAVAERELDPAKRKVVEITFVSARQARSVCGWAYVRGRTCRIKIPATTSGWLINKPELAMVIAHEFAHLRGARGERWMRGSARYGRKDGAYRIMYAWADDLPLEPAQPKKKEKPAPDLAVELKLAHIAKLTKQWQTKLKRAQTALKKYKRQEKYYTKKAAAIKASGDVQR